MKRFLKSSLIICFMLFVAFGFCACSSTMQMTIVNTDGTIDEMIYISLDEDEITSLGEDFDQLKLDITEIATKIATNLILQYVNGNTQLLTAVQLIEPYWYTDNSMYVGIRFANEEIYYSFYGLTSSNTAVWQQENHYFYTKYYQTGNTKFVLESSLITSITEQIIEKYPNFVQAENTLIYTYVTDDNRLHSDADYINNVSGNYYHSWIIDSDNLEETITVYYILANRGHVILVCIGVGLIVCAILCAIAFIPKRKNKNKNNNIDIDVNTNTNT